MNNLEQLLNSLVKLWWKPYWISRVKNITLLNRYVSFSKRSILWIEIFEYTLRSLVSKESWLWQFVCQKKLATARDWDWLRKQHHVRYKYADDTEEDLLHATTDFLNDYRLIESSLKDESELEDFLLSNIKVDVDGRW